jgi:hypothetical protein
MQNIAAALVKAQKAFGPALKNKANPHLKNKYADLASCIEAVIEALNDNGIAMLQPCQDSEGGVTVETLFLHESGESWSSGKLHIPAAKNDPQGFGSALTYARRYSLMAACGIAPEDDDGHAAARRARSEPAFEIAPVLATIAQAQTRPELDGLFGKHGGEATKRKDAAAYQEIKAACNARADIINTKKLTHV